LGSSLAVTMVAVLGGAGMLPSAALGPTPDQGAMVPVAAPGDSGDTQPGAATRHHHAPKVGRTKVQQHSTPVPGYGSADAQEYRDRVGQDATLPARSGSGTRVVFSQGRQRVWLVSGDDTVERTYLVSGSVSDNLDRGTYEVYSRSMLAYGINDSGTMHYFVRFAHGDNASIGFHDIPVEDGKPVQSVSELGLPRSHGCIRQRRADAIALWHFAPVGTTVVVV
jgi:hypothetical protein